MNSNEMVVAARICHRFTALTRASMDHLGCRVETLRSTIARPLLASSVDHALSLTHLLSQNDPANAYSAVALFRLQLDAMGRGVFFALPAHSSDEEVERFSSSSKMPKRQQPNGGINHITLAQLLDVARTELKALVGEEIQNRIDQTFRYALDHFNGFVHGGNSVKSAYKEINGRYIFLPDFSVLRSLAMHCAALALTAHAINLVHLCGADRIPISKEWEEARSAYIGLGTP
ncbi:MAG TPA: hypothetical protein VNZ27_00755 [Rhodanobacter sp.]|jgi:hypothetical protein|nr:hypothetical protein [Rhodanobacter sp.]